MNKKSSLKCSFMHLSIGSKLVHSYEILIINKNYVRVLFRKSSSYFKCLMCMSTLYHFQYVLIIYSYLKKKQ